MANDNSCANNDNLNFNGEPMVELLKFIDDLKAIKKSLGENTDNKTMKLIDETIKKYQLEVETFEKWLEEESNKSV